MSPAFRVEEGDQVTVGQCRPLSKTVCAEDSARFGLKVGADNGLQVRFNVLRVLPRTGKAVKGFQKF